jgi:hypothetical protein
MATETFAPAFDLDHGLGETTAWCRLAGRRR